jgi:hypothetical protein
MQMLGMEWREAGFVKDEACLDTRMTNLETSIVDTPSRAGVYAAVIALCSRRLVESCGSMANVWPPGMFAFWPTCSQTYSLWPDCDNVLSHCVKWLLELDGVELVEVGLGAPLRLAVRTLGNGFSGSDLTWKERDRQTPMPDGDALRALEVSRREEVKQAVASKISLGKPDPVMDAEILEKMATMVQNDIQRSQIQSRTAPDPRFDPRGFSRAFIEASEAQHLTKKEQNDAAMIKEIAEFYRRGSFGNAVTGATKGAATGATEIAVNAEKNVESEKSKNAENDKKSNDADESLLVQALRAEVSLLRTFSIEVLQDNARLRAERAV